MNRIRIALRLLTLLLSASSLLGAEICEKDPFYGGIPHIAKSFTREVPLLLTNCGYVVCYSEVRKTPLWAAYHLKKVGAVGEAAPNPPRKDHFRADPRTRSKVSSDAFAFSTTECDRGHMAPSYGIGSRFGPDSQDETFFMSNMAPQKAELNRQTWRFLEQKEADTYANQFGEVWIVTGPIFQGPRKVIRSSRVEIPSAFFKIIMAEVAGKARVLAYRMTQATHPTHRFEQFLTSVKDIENATGLDFLWELPDVLEATLENEKPDAEW